MARMKTLVATMATGAVAAYLFDPQMGRTRRARISDQLGAAVRRPVKRAEDRLGKKTQWAQDKARGIAAELHRREPAANDRELVDRVRSEVLGGPEYSGRTINVDAVDGVVALRGQLETPQQIRDLRAAVAAVPGVRDVESYLHLPGTPPPNKAEAMSTPKGSGTTPD